MNAKKKSSESRKWVALQLTLMSLASSGLGTLPVNAVNYPGVFVADTENRWNLPSVNRADDEQMGYVICDGGYLGSPLIPNEKTVVDQFLKGCMTGKRVGPGQLPVVDHEANYDHNSAGYQAYRVSLNGKEHYLCRGFLNSTEWCSAKAEARATDFANKIRSGQNVQTAQAEEYYEEPIEEPKKAPAYPAKAKQRLEATMAKSPEKPDPQVPKAPQRQPEIYGGDELIEEPRPDPRVAQEAAQEIADINKPFNYSGKAQGEIPKGKRAIQVTKEELEALHRGETTIDQLAEGRQPIDLEAAKARATQASAQIVPVNPAEPIGQASPQAASSHRAIEVSAEELAAVQNGTLSLAELTARKQIVSLNNLNTAELATAKVVPLETAPTQAQNAPQLPTNIAQLITEAKTPSGVQAQGVNAVPLNLQNLLAQAKVLPLSSGSPLPQPVNPPVQAQTLNTAELKVLPLNTNAVLAQPANITAQSFNGQPLPPSPAVLQALTSNLVAPIPQPVAQAPQTNLPPEVLAAVQALAAKNSISADMLPVNIAAESVKVQPQTAQSFQAPMPVANAEAFPPGYGVAIPTVQAIPSGAIQAILAGGTLPQAGFVNAQVPAMYGAQAMPLQAIPFQAMPLAPQYGQMALTAFENQPYAPAPYDMSMGMTPAMSDNGVPVTQAVTTIYGTHTNTKYWPGMPPGYLW